MKSDGFKIVQEVLCEDTKSKAKTSISIAGLTLAVGGSIVYGAGLISWAVYRLIMAAGSEGRRKCGKFSINTLPRQVCILKVKYAQLSIAYKYVKDASSKNKIKQKMMLIKRKIDEYTQDLARKGKISKEPARGTVAF